MLSALWSIAAPLCQVFTVTATRMQLQAVLDNGRGWVSVERSFVHMWFNEPPSYWVTWV